MAPERENALRTPAVSGAHGRIAVGVELVGYRRGAPAGEGELPHPRAQRRVVTPVSIPRNGPHDQARGLAPADPGDPHAHLLALALRVHLDVLDDLPHDLFPVGRRGRRRGPERRNICRELADGLALRLRQHAGLLSHEAVVVLLQLLLGRELLLPGPLQRAGDKAMLWLDYVVDTNVHRPRRGSG